MNTTLLMKIEKKVFLGGGGLDSTGVTREPWHWLWRGTYTTVTQKTKKSRTKKKNWQGTWIALNYIRIATKNGVVDKVKVFTTLTITFFGGGGRKKTPTLTNKSSRFLRLSYIAINHPGRQRACLFVFF